MPWSRLSMLLPGAFRPHYRQGCIQDFFAFSLSALFDVDRPAKLSNGHLTDATCSARLLHAAGTQRRKQASWLEIGW